MAKNKYSTALFEVIHSDKRYQNAHGAQAKGKSLLRTPKWWFKGRAGETPASEPADAAALQADPTLRAPAIPAATAAAPPAPGPAEPAMASEILTQPQPAPVIEATIEPAMAAVVPEAPIVPAPTPPPPRVEKIKPQPAPEPEPESEPAESLSLVDPTRPWMYLGRAGVRWTKDAQKRIVTLRLRYDSALAAAAVVLVLLGLAYLMGRHSGKGTSSSYTSLSTAAIKEGPVQPDVLDVGKNPAAGPQAAVPPPLPRNNMGDVLGNKISQQEPTVGSSPVQSTNLPRQVGLNYVVIQSYADRQKAQEACEILVAGGIDCTIEFGLPRFREDWYSVVGTAGFSRVRSPDFEAYMKKIKATSDQTVRSTRGFKPLEPIGYKWERVDRG